MKITIVVGGRWHAFDLARELQQAGHLHRLITNYPRWFVKRWGIPKDNVVSLPLTLLVPALARRRTATQKQKQKQKQTHQTIGTQQGTKESNKKRHWCSAATSTCTIPTPSAGTCR